MASKRIVRHGEEIVDELGHVVNGALDAIDVVGKFRWQRLALVHRNYIAGHGDHLQWRAQVVADHRVERFDIAQRALDGARAFGDAPFEVAVELQDLLFGALLLGDVLADADQPDRGRRGWLTTMTTTMPKVLLFRCYTSLQYRLI